MFESLTGMIRVSMITIASITLMWPERNNFAKISDLFRQGIHSALLIGNRTPVTVPHSSIPTLRAWFLFARVGHK
jgi:hypothetical protein